MRLNEHGGNVYQAVRAAGGAVDDFVDFSANINPLGMADSVRRAAAAALPRAIHYPDAAALALKEAVARHYGAPVECVTAGNGAVELLYLLCHCLRPRTALIVAPSFSEYERAARAAGAAVRYHMLAEADAFRLDVAALAPQLAGADIVLIGNPNNPTGNLLPGSALENLIKAAAAARCTVVVDESFLDFLPDDAPYTCRPWVGKYRNLVVVHSLTKFYAVPGLRLGFALSHEERAAALHAAKDPWNVNSIAQAAGAAALADAAYQERTRRMVARAKDDFYALLARNPHIKPFAPSVNFMLLKILKPGLTAGAVRRQLLAKRILIRDCSNYPGLSPYFLRCAVKSPADNALLAAALENLS